MLAQPRPVKFKTKFELLKHRPFQTYLGIYLIALTTMFIVGSVTIIQSFMDKTVPSIDYDEVNEKGQVTIGRITGIEIKEKITDNGEHPAVIAYRYNANGKEVDSKFQILDPVTVDFMSVGDEIEIKYLGSDSIINGFESYSFPIWLFVVLPIPFLIIGLVLVIPSIIKFRQYLFLYQYGKVGDAELISMTPRSGFIVSNFGMRILLHYRYRTSTGLGILGESITTDFSIINENKKGDMIKIFLSGHDESKSCVIPKLEAIRNDWRIDGVDK